MRIYLPQIFAFGLSNFLEEHLELNDHHLLPALPSCEPAKQLFWTWEKSRGDLSASGPISPKPSETPVGRQRKRHHDWELLACCVPSSGGAEPVHLYVWESVHLDMMIEVNSGVMGLAGSLPLCEVCWGLLQK